MKRTKIVTLLFLSASIGAVGFAGQREKTLATSAAKLSNVDLIGPKNKMLVSSLAKLGLTKVNVSKLYAIGRGIDVTRSGSFSCNSEKIQNDIFDRSWLNSFYTDDGYEEDRVSSFSYFKEYSSLYENQAIEYSFDQNSKADFSIEFLKFKLKERLGFSFDLKFSKKESDLVYNFMVNNNIFNYSLPSLEKNRDLFISNLTSDFIKDVTNAYNKGNTIPTSNIPLNKPWIIKPIIFDDTYSNTMSESEKASYFFPIFEKYGTHILWKGGFGGTYDIAYGLKTKAFSLNEQSRLNIETDVEAALEDPKINGGSGINLNLHQVYGLEENEITEKVNGSFVGGNPNGSIETTFNGINRKLDSWASSLEGKENIISYLNYYPIWEFVSNSSQKAALKKAYDYYLSNRNSYYENKNKLRFNDKDIMVDNYRVLPNGEYRYTSEKSAYKISFDLRDENEFYSPQKLIEAGYKTLTIQPSFTLKNLCKRKIEVTPKAWFDNLRTDNEKRWTYPLTEDKYNTMVSITGFELKETLDLSFLLQNHYIYNIEFCVDEAFWAWRTNDAEIYDLKLRLSYSK